MHKLFLIGVLVMGGLIGTVDGQSVPGGASSTPETVSDIDALLGRVVAIGDFNHDGIEDLIVAEPSGPTLWVGDEQGYFHQNTSLQWTSDAAAKCDPCRMCPFPFECSCLSDATGMGQEGSPCAICLCSGSPL